MHELKVSLSPSDQLRVTLPSGRAVDIAPTESGMKFLINMIREADRGERNKKGYIGSFPTQHVVDAWMRQEAGRLREEARETTSATARNMGVDLAELRFDL